LARLRGILRAGGLSLIAPYFVLYLRRVLGLGFAENGAHDAGFFAVLGVGQLAAPTIGGFALAQLSNPFLLRALLSAPSVPAVLRIALCVAPRLNARANRA